MNPRPLLMTVAQPGGRAAKFLGNPCKRGHTLRYRSDGGCVVCALDKAKKQIRIRA